MERFNGLLGIELFSAECFFQATKKARAEQVAQYFADLAKLLTDKGFNKVHIFLDRNPVHKKKMQDLVAQLTQHLNLNFTFHLMAAYSPKLNLVEYAIHIIRQKALHHADCKNSLADFELSIKELCINQNILNKEQIINILAYIESLVPNL